MHFLRSLLGVCLLFFLPVPVFAYGLSVGEWNVSGSQTWRTTFPLNGSVVNGASELYYPITGKYVTATLEYPLANHKTLTVEGGVMGSMSTAPGSDSDWDYSTGSNLWYYGTFDSNGTGHKIAVSIKNPLNRNADFFYGYSYNYNHYRMTNGLYIIENYTATDDVLSNLDSHYTMIYDGPYAGLALHHTLSPKVTAFASAAYTPLAFAQGHGWWNLRSLDFEHIGSAQMLQGTAGLLFAPAPAYSFTLGYRYQYDTLITGWENTSPDITWESAVNTQKGFYFSGKVNF
jgi:hypothetical protein